MVTTRTAERFAVEARVAGVGLRDRLTHRSVSAATAASHSVEVGLRPIATGLGELAFRVRLELHITERRVARSFFVGQIAQGLRRGGANVSVDSTDRPDEAFGTLL